MKNIGVIPNWDKENIAPLVDRVCEFLKEEHVNVNILPREKADDVKQIYRNITSWLPEVEMIIVIGGDGTILRVARETAQWKLPLLGINAGHKGFLAEIEEANLLHSLRMLIEGNFSVHERMILNTAVTRENRRVAEFLAVNDVVLSRGPFSRIIDVETCINGDYLETYSGDGLIVATSTGSTAYSLSAGGPIVSPSLEVFVITPICPHSLYNRSVIVDASENISIEILSSYSEIVLTIDGQLGFNLKKNDIVEVSRSPECARLISFPGSSFYRLLHDKLKG